MRLGARLLSTVGAFCSVLLFATSFVAAATAPTPTAGMLVAAGSHRALSYAYDGPAAATTPSTSSRISTVAARRAVSGTRPSARAAIPLRRAAKAGEEGLTGAEKSGMLRDAAAGKGNYCLGSATSSEAKALGRDWVGEGYTVASDGKTLVSSDGLRQDRPPTYKPNLGRYQANFERKFPGQQTRRWQGNGHLDITDQP